MWINDIIQTLLFDIVSYAILLGIHMKTIFSFTSKKSHMMHCVLFLIKNGKKYCIYVQFWVVITQCIIW